MQTTAGIWWESIGEGAPMLLINGLGTPPSTTRIASARYGREDRLVPLSAGEKLAAAIQHSELVVLEAAGHRLFTDQTATAMDAIADFLARAA